MKHTKEELRSLLLDDFDFPVSEVEGTVNCLLGMSDEGTKILDDLIATGRLADHGEFDVALMREYFLNAGDIGLITIYDGLFVRGGLNKYIQQLKETAQED